MPGCNRPMRNEDKTTELYDKICDVFPESHDVVRTVLANNPHECDLDILSDIVIEKSM